MNIPQVCSVQYSDVRWVQNQTSERTGELAPECVTGRASSEARIERGRAPELEYSTYSGIKWSRKALCLPGYAHSLPVCICDSIYPSPPTSCKFHLCPQDICHTVNISPRSSTKLKMIDRVVRAESFYSSLSCNVIITGCFYT